VPQPADGAAKPPRVSWDACCSSKHSIRRRWPRRPGARIIDCAQPR